LRASADICLDRSSATAGVHDKITAVNNKEVEQIEVEVFIGYLHQNPVLWAAE